MYYYMGNQFSTNTKEERQERVGLDDDFVEIIDTYKLENYPHEIKF